MKKGKYIYIYRRVKKEKSIKRIMASNGYYNQGPPPQAHYGAPPPDQGYYQQGPPPQQVCMHALYTLVVYSEKKIESEMVANTNV